VRFKPSGVNSNANAMTSAIGNPITIISLVPRVSVGGANQNR
jgi:hypothetical protein